MIIVSSTDNYNYKNYMIPVYNIYMYKITYLFYVISYINYFQTFTELSLHSILDICVLHLF